MFCGVTDPSLAMGRTWTHDGPRLVAVILDGRSPGWRAFAWTVGHARRSHCPVLALYIGTSGRLLAAMAYAYPLTAAVSVEDAVRRGEAIAAGEVRDQVTRLGLELGVPVRFESRPGASVRALLIEAEKEGADLLVMGASRRTSRGLPRQRVPIVVIP